MGVALKLNFDWAKGFTAFLRRYRYPALILLAGIVLMLWPSKSRQSEKTEIVSEPAAAQLPAESAGDYRKRMETELAGILSQIDGAGQVRVMLTLRSGESAQFQVNEETRTENDGSKITADKRTETVMIARGSSYNEPAVVRQIYPVFQGALIVSQGGDNAAVRYQLANAVSALLGIGTDQITVLKMK